MGSERVAVLLAAGGGSRFVDRNHKLAVQLAPTDLRPAETVARRSLAAALAADVDLVVVVTGRLDADDLGLTELAAEAHDGSRLESVHNADWESGQASSVAAGLAAAERSGAEVAVVGLADQPGIRPEAWERVARAATPATPIAVATYDGRRANPVGLHRTAWPLLPTTGDAGARAVMRIHAELVVEVPCPGSPDDIDTVEDLRRWQSS